MCLRRIQALTLILVAHLAAQPASAAKEVPPEPNNYSGIQVALGACVTQSDAGKGLGSTVLTAMISKGVNLLGAALTAAGSDKTWKTTGSRNIEVGSGTFPACIQVVRGRFRTDAPLDAEPGWTSEMSLPAGAYDTLKSNGLWPAERPAFFFEGALVPSGDKSAMTVRPLYAVLNAVQGDRALRADDERGVVLFFAFSRAGVSPNLEANPAATVVIGSMRPGRIMKFSGSPTKGYGTPFEASWFTLSEADARKPLTVTAMLSETQSGSPFFAFLASVFGTDAVKNAVTDKATVLLVPSAAEEASRTQQAAQTTAAAAADDKLEKALAKLAACKKAGADALSAGAEAKSALRDYLVADSTLPSPVKKVTAGTIGRINLFTPSAIAQGCADVYHDITGETLP
jgi:hypothetical protein